METEASNLLQEILAAVDRTSAPVFALAAHPSIVPSSTTSISLVAFNPDRKGFTIFNRSVAALYIAFGFPSSTTAFTTRVPRMSYYEMPFPIFVGQITGVWDSQDGDAQITELS